MFWRSLNPYEEFVPPMMLARRDISASAKFTAQHLAVSDVINVDQPPSWNAASALSTYLPTEQPLDPILNTIIMGLDNSLIAFVIKSKQMLLLNRFV
jgi:hypothetical protein